MAFDNTKLNYSSQWDIDQLVATGIVAVPIGTTSIFTLPSNIIDNAVYEVQFQVSGLSRWYQEGTYSTNGTLAGSHNFSSYIQNRQVYITTDTVGLARYFVWGDKVDY